MIVKKISKKEFENSNENKIKFVTADMALRKFSRIRMYDFIVDMAWASDLLDMDVIKLNNNIYFFGVDVYTCIIDFKSKKILYQKSLDFWYKKSILFEGKIFIITELSLITISLNYLNIMNEGEIYFPCLYKSLDVKESLLCINFFDNSNMTFDLKLDIK